MASRILETRKQLLANQFSFCPCFRVFYVALSFCAAFITAEFLGSVVMALDAPQWGTDFSRNMVSSETNLPDNFNPATGTHIKWKAKLGNETYATPVVSQGKVFIGTNNRNPRDPRHQGDRSVFYCLDEKDGTLLWQLVVPKLTNSIYWDWPHAGICSPATVEKDRAYLVSNRGEVLCLDLNGMRDGNNGPFTNEAVHAVPAGTDPVQPGSTDADIIWLFDIINECGVRQHDQAHSSILVDGDFLYINTSNGVDDSHRKIASPHAPSLIVLDKKSGRQVAQDAEDIGENIFHSTWSSPMLARIQGQRQIVFAAGNGVLYGFEPVRASSADGIKPLKKIWQFDCDPAAPKTDIHRYLTNRRESPSNIKSMPVFADGKIYLTAGGDLWWGKHEAWLKCIQPEGTGDLTKSALVWAYPLERHSMSTPSVSKGVVYVADCGRKLHAVDAATGKALWVHETEGENWGSTLVADGKVYLGTRDGIFWILSAGPEKRVISKVELDSPMHSSPVAANSVLYVATMNYIYAVSGK